MEGVNGLHHVTAIAGPPQENLDFYAGVLGMRLVKKSVNQDDPGTYHLFYADAVGQPGSDLTFFPWSQLAPSRPGHGLSSEVSLSVPPTAWITGASARKLRHRGFRGRVSVRGAGPPARRSSWIAGGAGRERVRDAAHVRAVGRQPVPVGRQIRGLESARMVDAT
jgi:glyoxalase family protein